MDKRKIAPPISAERRKPFDQVIQFIVGIIMNMDRPTVFPGVQRDARTDGMHQRFFDRSDFRRNLIRFFCGRGFFGLAGKLANERFGLPDVQALRQDRLQCGDLRLFGSTAQQCARVAFADRAGAERAQYNFRKLQEPERVRDRRAVFPDAFSDFLMRQAEIFFKAPIGLGGLDRRQVSALNIFDQREFKAFLIRSRSNDRGDHLQPGEFGGAQAAFAGDQEVLFRFVVNRQDQRLDDTSMSL